MKEEKEKQTETYSLHVRCTNCNYRTSTPDNMAKIEKGVRFSHWKLHNGCPDCGCKNLEKY